MTKIFKIPLTICFFLIFLLFTGCSKDSQGQDAKTPVQEETVQGKDIQPSMASEGETATSENQEVLPEGKAVFTGVEWSREDEERYAVYYGSEDICPDRDNGGVYYVNWGYDKYLYYWKDGKTKLVLDKWVSQICYMDGMVYCIYDKTGKTYDYNVTPSYEGVICSVNVKTGELKELSQVKAKELAVCKDRLYYEWYTGPEAEEQKQEYGFYLFSDKNVHKSASKEENGSWQFGRYGKYAIVCREDTFYIKNLEDNSEQFLMAGAKQTAHIQLYDGVCYYNKGDSLNSISLKDGKKWKSKHYVNLLGYAKVNNTGWLYISGAGAAGITVFDPYKDEGEYVYIKNTYSSANNAYMTEGLYSDGKYLYTIVSNGTKTDGIVGLVVLKADGKEISEIWSSLEYYNTKSKKQK